MTWQDLKSFLKKHVFDATVFTAMCFYYFYTIHGNNDDSILFFIFFSTIITALIMPTMVFLRYYNDKKLNQPKGWQYYKSLYIMATGFVLIFVLIFIITARLIYYLYIF